MAAEPTFGVLSFGDCIKICFVSEQFSAKQSRLSKETMKIREKMTVCIATDERERNVWTARCDQEGYRGTP